MNLFTQQIGSVLITILFFNSICEPCSVYKDRNDKGRGEINYKGINQTEVHRGGTVDGTARGHGRFPRNAVAYLPMADDLNLMADKALEKQQHSFTKPYGGFIELDCDTDVSVAILKRYARASRQWILNNVSLEIENDRMVYQMGMLTIQGLKASDQGVYICRIEYEPKQFKSVAVFTLVVETNEIKIRAAESGVLSLQSNSATLGIIFPTAKRAWSLNSLNMRSNISASKASEDRFLPANKSIEGIWTCTVSHQTRGRSRVIRTWKTARYVVEITPPPSKIERIMTYCSNHPVIIVMSGLVLGAFLLVPLAVCANRVDDEKLKAEEEMFKMKERLLSDEQGGKNDNPPNIDQSYNAYQARHGYDCFPQEHEQDYHQHENGHHSYARAFENEYDYNYAHENERR